MNWMLIWFCLSEMRLLLLLRTEFFFLAFPDMVLEMSLMKEVLELMLIVVEGSSVDSSTVASVRTGTRSCGAGWVLLQEPVLRGRGDGEVVGP